MAGVLAVEVRVTNRRESVLRTGSMGFEVRDGEGRSCLRLSPEKALRKVMKFYGNNFYPIESHRATEASYRAIAFASGAEIAPGGEHRGFLFFDIPRQAPLSTGYTLTITGDGAAATLSLTSGRE